jgi:phosphohistidine phosphatase
MSKTVYIIRHAKSRYAFPGESDFSRPLNETGLQEVEKMSDRLFAIKDKIDKIFCSSALRTRQTANGLCSAWGIAHDKIQFEDGLYHATEEALSQFISSINKTLNTVLIFAHNPGVTNFVNEISADFKIDDVPTCGAIGIEMKSDSWEDFEKKEKRIICWNYPNL